MRRWRSLGVVVGLLAAGCAAPGWRDVVFQTSTIDALLAGVYDGDLECGRLRDHGDLGIGTFDGLDGEMVLLDGVVYQVRADGKVYRPEPSMRTPFATVCRFEPQSSFDISAGSDFAVVQKLIDDVMPNQNIFIAIRITGRFHSMRTRSVPRQSRPYPPLHQVTQHQPEFEMRDVSGTIVGFRSPAYVKGINVPGYHLHFITDDRSRGGHILSLEVAAARCEVDPLYRFFLRLPESDTGFAETDLTRDRSRELQDVELGRDRPNY
ncbi:MAG TPA: acetolactate decarboxylase [Phycisphaerae bacterium]|nr:acetolactate decarboxylase [Phycisphaerae bacterium]HOM51357.1 acetolactate decarboxylase [Phycisphaerae bacterium]HON65885.1 acetolactate decarboxylase [Phycisphaerae bacterium]HOQ85012.1 acetolactate decarboxylase [Phycisphaerae bacterium]HPP26680.1 acetolactate decarboxylase [Phycisphaerae bacterium]